MNTRPHFLDLDDDAVDRDAAYIAVNLCDSIQEQVCTEMMRPSTGRRWIMYSLVLAISTQLIDKRAWTRQGRGYRRWAWGFFYPAWRALRRMDAPKEYGPFDYCNDIYWSYVDYRATKGRLRA